MRTSRGGRFIVVFLLLAVVTSMTGLAVMYFMVSRAPTVSSNSVLSLRLPGGALGASGKSVPDLVLRRRADHSVGRR